MGSLGGVVASRIAREFQIGGPSFSISCDENSGIQALAIAADWLERRELDAVVVGAVDFAGDIRAVLARAQLGSDPQAAAVQDRPKSNRQSKRAVVGQPFQADVRLESLTFNTEDPAVALSTADETAGPVACDGAVCLIVKRLDDAQRDGDRIAAVIRGASTRRERVAVSPSNAPSASSESTRMDRGLADFSGQSIGYLDVQTTRRSALVNSRSRAFGSAALVSPDAAPGGSAVGSILGDVGHVGAAAGLAAVAKAAVCLGEEIIPAPHGSSEWLGSLTEQLPSLFVPGGRQFWLRNRAQGPRRAAVRVCGLGGVRGDVVLDEFVPLPDAGGSSVQGSEASGARTSGLFLLEASDQTGLTARIEELSRFASGSSCQDIDALARRWWQRHPGDRRLLLATAIVADGIETLKHLLEIAAGRNGDHRLEGDGRRGSIHAARARSDSTDPPSVAFVYPGLGCHFAGMGRELSALWPDVLRRLDAESSSLRDQFEPAIWWAQELPPAFVDHRIPIVGGAWAGSLVTEILRGLGVNPQAAIGYSMGESTALVALRAWTDRDLLLSRIRTSPLFRIDLAGPCEAARRYWVLDATEPVDWVAGVVSCSAESIEAVIGSGRRVYILIRNSADETVIGGQRKAVDEVVEALRSAFVELPHVSTVHCEIGRVVDAEYRALHDLETNAPAGIDFYSGVWGHAYRVDRRTAADAITAQATRRIDFPAVIERAYQDGVRVFLELGPGGSCTRHIDRILGDRPHRALSACRADREPFGTILEVLGTLLAERVPVDLAALYGSEKKCADAEPAATNPAGDPSRRTVRVEVRGRSFSVPQPPRAATTTSHGMQTVTDFVPHPPLAKFPEGTSWSHHLYQAERATAEAHRAFLRTSQQTADLMARLISFQFGLLQSHNPQATSSISLLENPPVPATNDRLANSGGPVPAQPDESQLVLDRAQCLEFAVGSIASVLGLDYAPIDGFPTRVRLPDEPLMLVDRIVAIEGRPRSLEEGRVVTEHVVRRDAWYLDAGKVPPCIAIEAGQADLFLSAYLGADFVTEGRAVYRLLDATVTFQRGLPGPRDVIRYDIRINHFFRQGNTMLFRFQFDATVDGEPLLTMRDGCAGFFSAEELAAGKGIVTHKPEPRAGQGPPAEAMADLVSTTPGPLDERQVDALRTGDLAAAFGSPFVQLAGVDLLRLPAGRMALLHRVALLDPKGGPHGLGLIRAEAD
ncbi:MAG TPA: beta-ketoacyl synthase N-terminal-like domain-containing protein, partial [Isosphaeraceae bacterium]|nr:beta-ketoacyl synthase N-terminal-like domain-containing protein [Isosphaeraceae bacterium]